MYHDLRLAEVVTVSGRRLGLAKYEYPNELMFQPDEKVQQNLFLAELLGQFVQYGLAAEKDRLDLEALFSVDKVDEDRETTGTDSTASDSGSEAVEALHSDSQLHLRNQLNK